MIKNHFGLMFKDYLILNSYILKYKHNQEGFNYTQGVALTIDKDFILADMCCPLLYKCDKSLMDTKCFLPKFKNMIQKLTQSDFYFDLFYKPSLYFLIFLIFGSFFSIKNGMRAILTISPIIFNVFFISISLPEMCPRYVFLLFLTYPIIILLSFVKIKKEI